MINILFLTLQLSNLLFLLSFSTRRHISMAHLAILSNFFEEQWTKNHPQHHSGLSRVLFPTTFLEIAVYRSLQLTGIKCTKSHYGSWCTKPALSANWVFLDLWNGHARPFIHCLYFIYVRNSFCAFALNNYATVEISILILVGSCNRLLITDTVSSLLSLKKYRGRNDVTFYLMLTRSLSPWLLLHLQLHLQKKQLIMPGYAVFLLMWALVPSGIALMPSAHHQLFTRSWQPVILH